MQSGLQRTNVRSMEGHCALKTGPGLKLQSLLRISVNVPGGPGIRPGVESRCVPR
jgi:hypothetical protein